jgi:hypothetical protein
MEAPPIPIMEVYSKRPNKLNSDEYIIKNYKLTLSKTDNNSVIFEAKLEADFVTGYYELEYQYMDFPKLSELFSKCNNFNEVYQLLIDNLNKYKDEIKISAKNDCIELSFSLDASTNKKERVQIYMDRKQININILLNKLNSKIEEVQNNQKNLENTIENIINDMNLIRDRQNNIEKEINSIKSIQSKYKTKNNVESDDYKKIKAISDKIFENFEKIKNERISYSKIEQKVEELNKRNDENKNIINNQKNMIDELNNRVSNCKNTLEEKSKEKIESAINLILSIKNQNETLTKKMNDNEKKIKKLQMKLEKKVIKKDKGKRPNNYKLEKNISSDLFEKKNYDNKSACIFNYNEDDNIYVVYGVKTFDLECYDIQNDNKFIIIKKLHGDLFYSCRHFFNEERYQDLIITSSFDRHVKVTNFQKEKSEVILDLNLEENQKPINTAYFSHDYIIVPFSDDSEGSVQIYSMDPYLIEEFEDNSGFILGLTTYFCEKRDQNFILVSNRKGILSYIIDKFYLFQKYSPGYSSKEIMDNEIIDENGFSEAYVIEENDNLILVGPSFNQGLYFWDFISGDLISKMDIMGINNICLWNNDFILASVNKSELCEFILINAYNKKIDKKIGGGMTDQIGCGIQLLRNLSKGNFLISFSNKGELKLYTLESK